MPARTDPDPHRALALGAIILLSLLSLGLIATSQTLWLGA